MVRSYLTFDCEWCDNIIGTKPRRSKLELRLVRRGLTRFLTLCNEKGVSGTIFVTADIAPLVVDLLQEAIDAGFEIASHGFNHTSVLEQTVEQFKDDLVRSKDELEGLLSVPILSYRAPSFSMPISKKYFEILDEVGFQYDFSAPLGKHISGVSCDNSELLDIYHSGINVQLLPMVGIGKSKAQFPGGGYFRVMTAKKMIRNMRDTENDFILSFYIHPRDMLNFYAPRNTLSPEKILKACLGIPGPVTKLSRIIEETKFVSLKEFRRNWAEKFYIGF